LLQRAWNCKAAAGTLQAGPREGVALLDELRAKIDVVAAGDEPGIN
jgi:hypothetical protein